MKASEAIRILADYIHKYGDLQIAIEDQEFFTHSSQLQFEITKKSDDAVLYENDERLDKEFISIRA